MQETDSDRPLDSSEGMGTLVFQSLRVQVENNSKQLSAVSPL